MNKQYYQFLTMLGVSCFTFLWRLLWSGSLNSTLDSFGSNSYYINFYVYRKYVIKDKVNAKKILGRPTRTTSWYNTFSQSHGLANTISNVNENQPIWKILHTSLSHAVNNSIKDHKIEEMISQALSENIDSLYEGDLNEFVDAFFDKWWTTFIVGKEKCDEYYSLMKRVLTYFQHTFYDNRWQRVPLIGKFVCWFNRMRYSQERNDILRDIKIMMGDVNSGVLGQFKQKICESGFINPSDIVANNVFLSFLVFDFEYMFVKGIIVKAFTDPSFIDKVLGELEKPNFIDRPSIKEVVRSNFLYPNRVRSVAQNVILDDGTTVRPRDTVIINLLDSDIAFSHGKRRCVGWPLVRLMASGLVNCLKDHLVIKVDDNPIIRRNNPDIPMIESKHKIMIIRKDIIRNQLPQHVSHSGPVKLEIQQLYSMMVFRKHIMLVADEFVDKYKPDCIAAPDARGLMLAGMMMERYGLPGHMIRPAKKLMGDSFTADYTVGYDQSTKKTIGLPGSTKLLDTPRVIIVDDGLASGGTLQACIDVVHRTGGEVVGVFVIVKHNYCEMVPSIAEIFNEKITCVFDI